MMKKYKSVPGVLVSWWLVLSFVALTACGKTETPAAATPGAPAPAASAPVVSVPASGHILRLAEGGDLSQIANQQMIHPQFTVAPPAADSPLIFAVLQNEQKHATAPVILKKIGNRWKITELAEAPQQQWGQVAIGPAKAELWAILDAAGDNESEQITLLHSTDAGNSWQFAVAVQKVSSFADFSAFSLAKSGQGRLTLHLTEDDDNITHGYYHYTTSDGGKSFRGPSFEPDDTAEAESLKSSSLQDALQQ
jgi:hypothetical protein